LSQPVSCGCVWKLLEGFLNQPELPEIVGESAALQRVRETIGRVSPSEVNVLISGESGTGKELVAELIHRSSTRSKGPFVSVNCAAIPDSLLESELFGHAKGAFTGADCSREGKFSEADGGTLFLDEIGDMSHYAQAKVLRAIETKRIDRLGARGGHLVNIRVLVATNRNLEQMMSTGQFRQDLYFRLNVIELNLPPLRERKEDIASLVTHFTSVFNRRFGADLSRFSDEVLDALCSYHWPGNVRELRNLFEAIYINSPPRILSLGDLPESFRRRLASAPSDKSRMLDALASTQWNKSKAAKSLGWSRVTLYRKLAQYHVSPSSPPNSATAPASLSRESYK
jgi:DNA-binding NtrC family response regulator